jgi:hypothetical protein
MTFMGASWLLMPHERLQGGGDADADKSLVGAHARQ